MLRISDNVKIPDEEMEITAIRAQGAGGQNVNQVSSAVHLRFDVRASSLPDFYKQCLLAIDDRRLNKDGVIVIKAQRHRTREKNRAEALQRLAALVRSATFVPKRRKPGRPTRSSQRKRLDQKSRRGNTKALRGKVTE